MTYGDRFFHRRTFRCCALALLTFVLRLASASGPYFADAFRHIHAIESGMLVIHAPGYFLFNLLGFLVVRLLHVSAGSALQIINIGLSTAGAPVFYLLLSRLPSITSPLWLSLAYVCSPVIWFSGDVHSTYASVTFFAPLLILVVEVEQRFVYGCIVWAVLFAFRPSDGIFVLPWMAYHAVRHPWKERFIGIATTIPLIAAWWIPTIQRYHGDLLSPVRYSGDQAHGLAQGIVTGLSIHAALNAVHALAGMIMTWGLLTPFVCLGVTVIRQSAVARSMAVYMLPGVAYFLLYYVADGPYVAYLGAAGFVLAGEYLTRWPSRVQQAIYAVAICASLLFMICGRMVEVRNSQARALADAYFLKYSIPSLKQQKDPRLASLLGKCHDSSVRGICKE